MLGSHVRVMGRCPLWHEVFFWTRVHIQQGVRSMKHLLVIAAVVALFCVGLDGGMAIAQEPPPDGGMGGGVPFDQQRYDALRVQHANEILRQAFVMANSTQQNDPYLDDADALLAHASMAGTECETIIMRAYRDAEIVERALGLRQ